MNEKIKEILSKYKTIAMVGVSKDDKKPSTIVMKYMQKYGFKVIPVNPSTKGQKILGEEVFEKLEDIKIPIDIVDVFRPSDQVLPIIKEAIKKKPKVIWLQEGIHNEEAEQLARDAGIYVIFNRCMLAEHRRLA